MESDDDDDDTSAVSQKGPKQLKRRRGVATVESVDDDDVSAVSQKGLKQLKTTTCCGNRGVS